jgi:hypothetical protein
LKEALQDLRAERHIEWVAKPKGVTPKIQGNVFLGLVERQVWRRSRAFGSGYAER